MTCPAGLTRRLTARNAVISGAACRACPLREKCTTAKDGRTLHLHEHDSLLRAARAEAERFAMAVPSARVAEIDANHYTITTHDDSIAAIGAFLRTS